MIGYGKRRGKRVIVKARPTDQPIPEDRFDIRFVWDMKQPLQVPSR